MSRRILTFLVVVCLSATAALAAHYAGRPLSDALRDLETRGLRLIYSDDIVTPSMIVKTEPRASDPRRVLDELLREHQLHAKRGPRGTLLIVRDEAGKKTTSPQMPVTLAQIVVTPSRFEILAAQPEQRRFLGREEVRALPHLSDDLFRALAWIPGVATNDESARVNIRGGAEDEVIAILDGAEIYDPYHLKDLFRAFSTIDSEAVGSVDVLTGGFPVEYGGRMSGVIDISTIAADSRHVEVGISLLNTRVLSYGTFNSGGARWLVSFRRGYLREVLNLIDVSNTLDPHYYDLLGNVQWTIGDAALASVHVLASRDLMRSTDTFDASSHARYSDTYVWLNARGSLTPRLFAQSVLSYGRFSRDRSGNFINDFGTETGSLHDRRSSDFVTLKNDGSFDVTPRNIVKGGVTLRRLHAQYDYDAAASIQSVVFNLGDPPQELRRSAHVRASSTEVSAYAADRMRIGERVVAEAGARFESETHTPDGAHVSPRINVSWFAADRTIVRAAWGRFYQPEAIYELPVEDGVTEFGNAQRADHRILGIEQILGSGNSARLELYDKSFSHLRPRFENLYDRLVVFPELRSDRMRIAPERAAARGAEILFRHDNSSAVSGWISYAWARVTDVIDGRDVPRSWDQRHTVNFSVNYRLADRWNFNLAGNYHSGRPTTPISARVSGTQLITDLGPLNSDRLPTYRRVDFRVSRNAGRLGVFVELFNVLNFTNAQRVNSFTFTQQSNGDVATTPLTESVFGIVPSFGITWRF